MMLSILIPTYNYNVYPLVREIHKQIQKTGINFEVLVFDDASSEQKFETSDLLQLSGVHYKKMQKNIGRTAIRYQLAETAKYNHLLFLDADVFPKDRFFILKYLKTLEKTEADLYFGGVKVPDNLPSIDVVLRWKFGKERESLPVEKRKKRPYLSVISQVFLIKKDVFLDVSKPMVSMRKYGLDAYFTYLLKQRNTNIYHFNNPVTHLGLETNAIFLQKTERALQTYHYLIKNNLIDKRFVKITAWASIFSHIKLRFLCKIKFWILHRFLRWNLLSDNPSLFLFDIYKLLYYCKLK